MPNSENFLDLVRRRRSCRAYLPDSVSREYIEKMIEAALVAPSACNKQPWRFVVVENHEKRAALASQGLLPGLPAGWVADVPVIIALGMQRSVITHRLAPVLSKVDYPLLDLGIAGEHLVLQATELGLGTCWIGWIRPVEVRKILDWSSSIQPVALITVGWPDEEKNTGRKARLPESETVRWVE